MKPTSMIEARPGLRRALIVAALAVHLASSAAGVGAGAERELTDSSFAELRAQHAGRPWVVHLWGETCGPCLADMPQWRAMMKSVDVPLVLIQADASTGRANRHLAANGLTQYPRWATRQGLDEFARARIDPTWAGELPRTLLIAADGSTTAISGTVDPTRLRRWVSGARGPR
jgi:thiol-disulfide isomerase/thioredoxin